MSPELTLQLLGAVALILFLVALIMGHKSWRVHTIILVVLVMGASCTMFWFSWMTLRTHQSWRTILHGPPGKAELGLIAQTEKVEEEIQLLRYGRETAEGVVEVEGIEQLEQKLRAVIYDRGRIWQNCVPGAMLPTATSVNVNVDEPKPHRINVGTVLYVFDSKSISAGGTYLGEFKVTAAADPADAGADEADPAAAAASATITLTPMWKMSPSEAARLQRSANTQGPWTLFDKMPADGHFVFENLDDVTAEELGIEAGELASLDRVGRLGKLLHAAVLNKYIKDHQPAADTDPDSRVEVLVEFRKRLQADDFEPTRDDEDEQFRKDGQVWLLKEAFNKNTGQVVTVAQLEQDERIKVMSGSQPRYSRELSDYGLSFRNAYLHRGRQQDRIDFAQLDSVVITGTLGNKTGIVTTYDAEKARLDKDKAGFLNDLQIISKLYDQLRQQTLSIGQRMNLVRRQNSILAARIDENQMRAVESLNRRNPPPQAGVARPNRVAVSQ